MESAGNSFNFDIVTDRYGSVIKHPDDLTGANARRPSTCLDDAYEIITKAPLDDLDWYGHVGMDTANLYQGAFNVAMGVLAQKDDLGIQCGRLRHWSGGSADDIARRLSPDNIASAHNYGLEMLEPQHASNLATRVLANFVDAPGLADVIERHLSNPTVNLANPSATIRLIVHGEERSVDDPDGNLSYVIANYVPPSLQTKLAQARPDIIGSHVAEALTRCQGNLAQISAYWPKHPYAASDQTTITATKLLKYGHILADIPGVEMAHRINFDADIEDQPLDYRRKRAQDYITALHYNGLHQAASHHIQTLAEERTHDELQMELLDRLYYASSLDKILHYNYCVAEPGSHELDIFRAMIRAIPERIYSHEAGTDRKASQDVLQHFYDPEYPENSRISPVVRIKLPQDRQYKILGQ